ncbi:MAG: hypothetical protein PHX34_04375 [Candidatus Shapirobacteria bacterium]|nr:hypothetical protein [Candidatus Shapirobacteria bacterium]
MENINNIKKVKLGGIFSLDFGDEVQRTMVVPEKDRYRYENDMPLTEKKEDAFSRVFFVSDKDPLGVASLGKNINEDIVYRVGNNEIKAKVVEIE